MVTLAVTVRNFSGIFGDNEGPSAPVIAANTLSSSSIEITLVTPSSDATAVDRYQLERSLDGVSGWTVESSDASFPYPSTGLGGSTQYFYRCRAVDTLNNVGAYSAVVSDTTEAVSSGGVFFQPNIGLLANGNTLVSSGTFDDVNRDLGGDAVVQSAIVRPGGQSKSIDISYIQDESMATLNVYNTRFPASPVRSLFCRKWEMFENGWSNNWPVGFKTSRYFTDGIAYCSEKFIWQRYTGDGGSRNNPVWGLNHATYENDRVEQYTANRILPGQWHKYETWMVLNSALNVQDGILRCWIDDVLVIDELIAWVKTASPSGSRWMNMWFGGNCSFSPGSGGWPFPTGQTLHRYLDSPYLSTTLDR